MSEATVVDARLDKLEQDNRRLKLALGALLLALAAVPLIGAVMPEQIPQAITARAFYVEDENGTERVKMDDGGIGYGDDDGVVALLPGFLESGTDSFQAEDLEFLFDIF